MKIASLSCIKVKADLSRNLLLHILCIVHTFHIFKKGAMTAPKDHKMMDDEDLGIELDKLHASQQGKSMEIDQDKVKNDVDVLVTLAKSGQTQQAIDGLLSIEKQGRLAEDITSTRIACTTILEARLIACTL